MAMSDSCDYADYGRLEVVLDRSWETRPVTWSNLTWWDPLPCGLDLVSSLKSSEPLPLPSPALSVVGQPPTPQRRLPPTQLQFRSCSASPSPIPTRAQSRYSSYCSSPLAWPLPPSPSPDSQSYNSVFLHSDSSTPPYQEPPTPSSLSSHYCCSSPMYPTDPSKPIFPTPPDCCSWQGAESRRDKFSFTRPLMPVSVPLPGQVPGQIPVLPQAVLVTPPDLSSSHSRLLQAGSNSYY